MLEHKDTFDTLLRVKSEPNNHEAQLFERGKKYTQKLSKIPGIEMIAIVNSLSMYATHEDSDIDLFIVTKPGMIWFVRFFCTLILWKHGVWRQGKDITSNFCLSFFITTEGMDLSKIAIENDIYLYYWVYYMKPIIIKNDTYHRFLESNTWVKIDENQKMENEKYKINVSDKSGNKRIEFYKKINQFIRYFLLPKTMGSQIKLGNPEGVIISDMILKFHDQDRRKKIRDTILENNFDK